MGAVSTIRNAFGSRLLTADQKFVDQFEKAGVFMLKQEDFLVRHRHLQWLNDAVENPFIEINDKIKLINRAIGEVGATFAAMGGNKTFTFRAMNWKVALNEWNYKYYPLKNAHSYYSVRLNIQEGRLVLDDDAKDPDKPAKFNEVFETRQDEVDADTYLNYYKTMPDRVEVLDVIPHGGIGDPTHSLPAWRGSQDRLNAETTGLEWVNIGEFCVWSSFLPEHVNPRSMIVIHATQQQNQQQSWRPEPRPDDMRLDQAADRFKNKK